MTWNEWEQIKADVAERRSAGMTLDHAPERKNDGEGDLNHSRGPWARAAGAASDLSRSMTTAKSDLDSADKGVSAGLQGLASLGSLTTVLASWDERLTAVQGECRNLNPALLGVSKTLGEVDGGLGKQSAGVRLPHHKIGE
ncbi:amino acid ABC transporter permease [Streptomyces sp. NPDC050560]|uniref:amino acid ABC transporter permease n=1 Tax=Streptomyces sp. NPDC050560 TaxID=3365630 RepID=UPI0037958F8C